LWRKREVKVSKRGDFGQYLDVAALSDAEVDVLHADVREVMEEDGLSFDRAERELRRRLGGQENLRSYMDCLMAGARNRAGLK
jgi:hypothetical protein